MTALYLALGALALAIVTAVRWFRAVYQVALPRSRTGYLLAMFCVALASVAALAGSPGIAGGVAAGVALVIAAFFFLTVAISRQVTGKQAITVGSAIPHFTATDENGEHFDSLVLAGNPALIKFFRGHW
jgi:hypothetical protein